MPRNAFHQLVNRAKAQIRQLSPMQVRQLIGKVRIIDIREPNEWRAGRIPTSCCLPRGILEREIEALVPDKSAPIVLYCAKGLRSALAALSLQQMGYRNVWSMAGGYERWVKEIGK